MSDFEDEEEEYEYQEEDEDEYELAPPGITRQETNDSTYSYNESDGEQAMDVDDNPNQAPAGVLQDCREVNAELHGVGVRAGCCRPTSTSQAVYVWVSIDPHKLFGHGGMDAERSSALGINPSMPLFLRIEFHTAYTSASTQPTVRVLQAPATIDLDVKEVDGQVECGLSWLLQHRLREYLKLGTNWPPSLGRNNPHAATSAAAAAGQDCEGVDTNEPAIVDIMDTCACSREVAQAALEGAKGDPQQAMMLFFDDEQRQNFETKAAVAAAQQPMGPSASQGQGNEQQQDPDEQQTRLEVTMARHNFLVRLMLLVQLETRRSSTNCLICGNRMENPGVRPSVCAWRTCRSPASVRTIQ